MSNLYWLSEEQMGRLKPYFPKSRGKPRVDDRRILSGIIFINRNDLRWSDAPAELGPPKTLYNRWKRWSDMGVLARIITGLAAEASDDDRFPKILLSEIALAATVIFWLWVLHLDLSGLARAGF